MKVKIQTMFLAVALVFCCAANYRPDGTAADDASRGILIQDNQKFVRK